MFDFSSGELLLIALAVLIFIKPKDLPAVLRAIGQWTGKIRRMAGEFQDQFREAMREAEMADLKKSMDEMTDAAKGITDFDPIGDVRKEVESFASDPLGTSNTDAATDTAAASSASPEAASQSTPAPVAADTAIASTETPVAPAAPQSGTETEPKTEPKTGSGA